MWGMTFFFLQESNPPNCWQDVCAICQSWKILSRTFPRQWQKSLAVRNLKKTNIFFFACSGALAVQNSLSGEKKRITGTYMWASISSHVQPQGRKGQNVLTFKVAWIELLLKKLNLDSSIQTNYRTVSKLSPKHWRKLSQGKTKRAPAWRQSSQRDFVRFDEGEEQTSCSIWHLLDLSAAFHTVDRCVFITMKWEADWHQWSDLEGEVGVGGGGTSTSPTGEEHVVRSRWVLSHQSLLTVTLGTWVWWKNWTCALSWTPSWRTGLAHGRQQKPIDWKLKTSFFFCVFLTATTPHVEFFLFIFF